MYRLISAMALTGLMSAAAVGQPTSFTYQGQLKEQGLPLNGPVDMRFTLYDSESAVTPMAGPIACDGLTFAPVEVTNGLFTVELDFGSDAFQQGGEWLQVAVRAPHDPTDTGAYTALTPWQHLTAAPFALSVPGLATTESGVEVSGDIHTPGEVTASAFSSNSPLIFKVNPANVECARFEDDNCYLGLGTPTPLARLHIGGTPGVDGIRFPDGSLQTSAAGIGGGDGFWSANGTDIFNNNGGNVGIGTSTPANKLTVLTPTLGYGVEHTDGNTRVSTFVGRGSGWLGTLSNHKLTLFANDNGFPHMTATLDTAGNFGIGTDSPLTKLHITAPDSVSHRVEAGGGTNAWSKVEFVNGNGQWHIGTSRGFVNDVFYVDRPTTAPLDLLLSTAGNLGLGIFPEAKLDLYEPVGSISQRIQTGGGTNAWAKVEFVNGNGQWHMGTSRGWVNDVFYLDRIGTNATEFVFSTAGSLGLGIEPSAKLHMFDPVNSVSHRIQSGAGTNGWTRVEFANGDGQWNVGTSRNFNGNQFYFHREGSQSIALGIQPNGDAFLQGTMSCKVLAVTGADVAEKFPSSEDHVEPGTVMEIDPENTGKLRVVREAYSTRVAGVVSGAGDLPAGAVLGNFPGSENAPAIALSGRVWVRCDATSGAIMPGDLLTTSSSPGLAMKASDRGRSHGAVLGKAMTALAEGQQGLVLVLVNLQ